MRGRGVGFVGLCLVVCAGVVAAPAGAETFSNPTTIQTVAAFGNNGALYPYPSPIAVDGQAGTVTNAKATLTGISHGDIDELEAMLVAPGGQHTLLMSSPCADHSTATSPVVFTFDDGAAAPLAGTPPCPSGTYRPSDYDAPSYSFVYPVPPPPYMASLSALNGVQPNGIWELFVVDDTLAGGGSINGGWSLELTSSGPAPATVPAPQATLQPKKCKKRKHARAAKKKRCKKARSSG